MILPMWVKFKEGHEEELLQEYQEMRPTLRAIAEAMGKYFVDNKLKLIITDIMSDETEDVKLGRISASHREGRAFDFRTNGLPPTFLATLETKFERLYRAYAAVSSETGMENLIVYHNNGNGRHAHVQIRRGV